uniref:jmjC domain-containing protein 4-like isoform X1 n=1 Tax=Ciona intestinalis TaxID=7719 RepID=UPI000180BA28|nr:jmjC domain-containing protein 4-like isoform X1 [Ciona intestinalis]|eukprot:XP_002119797.1 jmjC domain-containing protein 4-like isoform X1 [Ciona intestinalis]
MISGSVLNEICKDSINLINGEATARSTHQTSVPKIENPISYSEFFSTYLLKNQPCILTQWATKDWPCMEGWRFESRAGEFVPNFDKLVELFGETEVPVADCSKKNFNSHEKIKMKFKDFVKYWKSKINGDNEERSLYLKDWHCRREFPSYDIYTTPPYFTSDWLNELFDKVVVSFSEDDYRFVYMGPTGTWTPFHADVYRSYSWSANICGRKKWVMFPPSEEEKLKDINGHLPFDIRDIISDDVIKPTHIEVEQEAGEIMFVPSGWHHQVYNMEDTISINHNWFNGCCINLVWRFLQSELRLVEREIDDCRASMDEEEWTNHCQVLMLCNTGINYQRFHSLLEHIIKTRCDVIMRGVTSQPKTKRDKRKVDYDVIKRTCISTMTSLRNCLSPVEIAESQCLADLCLVIPTLLEMLSHCYCARLLFDICDVIIAYTKQFN